MPLPKINTPTYELTLPSNNKKIKYRPFLVREEKILILALESSDAKQITTAVVDILSECVLTKNIDAKLATFDIEYLFLNVRSKSVGETVDVNITCPMMERHLWRCQSILIIKFRKLKVIRVLSNSMINIQ